MLLEPVLPFVEPDPAPASTRKGSAAKRVAKTTTKTDAVRKP